MAESGNVPRVPIGISNFDKMITGGIPKGFNVMVAGSPGSGKSIFCQKYLYTGAKNGESGLYISLDETRENILRQALQFSWDFEKLEKENLLLIKRMKLSNIDETIKDIEKLASKINAKRIVIDSISTLFELTAMYQEVYQNIYDNKPTAPFSSSQSRTGSIKKSIYSILDKLKELNATVLTTSEAVIGSDSISRDGISEFVCDGIIHLNRVSMGQTVTRTIEVKKMRQTNVDGGVHFFTFGKSGITVTDSYADSKVIF